MKTYIIIHLFNNSVAFDISNNIHEFLIHLNKNFLTADKCYYEYNYFKRHYSKIIRFLKQEIDQRKINNLIIKNIFILDFILTNLQNLNLPLLEIQINESFTRSEYEKIVNYKNLKKLICYYIPPIYRRRLSNRNIEYAMIYKNYVSDAFIINNDCIDHDTLYYKRNIVLKDDSPNTLNDLNEFLKLNHNLKVIHLYKYSTEFILKVIKLLKEWNEYRVVIYLYQNYDFNEFLKANIKSLRKVNKEYYKNLNGELKIMYSKKYIVENLFKQLSFNNLKMMLVITGYVAFAALFFNEFYSYISINNMNELENLISVPNESEEENENQTPVNDKYNFEQIFPKLLEINNETVGWLHVNNTNINYPVVKHTDNDYYLKRDFYKSKTSNGWVFMDYRNQVDELDENTIIFGHRLKNDTIFGSLDLVLKKSWYTNPDNLIVTFNSINENMGWEVFSIYRVDYTVDYLKTNFNNKEEFDEFVHLISNRSVYNFGVNPDYGDNILTLSTCIGDNGRLVLHAKLIK